MCKSKTRRLLSEHLTTLKAQWQEDARQHDKEEADGIKSAIEIAQDMDV